MRTTGEVEGMGMDVLLPRAGTWIASRILHGSGVVGADAGDGQVLIDYEGNRAGAANIVTWADRVARAAERHETRYPTTARMLVDAADLERVGRWDPDEGEVRLLPAPGARRLVADWLGIDALPDAELLSTSHRHVMRREVRAALASPDPGRRQAARYMADRYHLGL